MVISAEKTDIVRYFAERDYAAAAEVDELVVAEIEAAVDEDTGAPVVSNGARFRFTPDRTGTWTYRCKEHGDERDMTLTVR